MNALQIWPIIGWMTVATIITRGMFFVLSATRLPAKVQHALRYAPAAALAAIVIPDLLLQNGSPHLSWTNPRLMAGLGAIAFFLVTRHVLGTIVAGMVLFAGLRLVL